MYDYSYDNRAPWDNYNKRIIKRIIIGDGITTIGSSAFRNCFALNSVTIPNSVRTIGEAAFEYCIYNHRTTKTNQKYPSVNL